MAKKKYESTMVRVPGWRRAAKILFASSFCLVGIVFIGEGFASKGTDPQLLPIGGLLLVLGAIALFQWRGSHEPQLTDHGKAAKAEDERREVAKREAFEAGLMRLGFTVLVIFALIYFPQTISDAIRGKVRAYTVECVGPWTSNGACDVNGWRASNVSSFTVHSDQQLVVGRSLEGSSSPYRLFNCAIEDRTNWSCTLSADQSSDRIAMHEGSASSEALGPEIRFVPRLRWWYIRLTNGST
jgi:hypothetical protein